MTLVKPQPVLPVGSSSLGADTIYKVDVNDPCSARIFQQGIHDLLRAFDPTMVAPVNPNCEKYAVVYQRPTYQGVKAYYVGTTCGSDADYLYAAIVYTTEACKTPEVEQSRDYTSHDHVVTGFIVMSGR